jgi:4-hydroxy-3-methylbut-2-enyl diphosphate reductase
VVRAIQVVEECLDRFGPPIYVKHQIVHNPHVVGELEAKGAVTVETVEEIPEGSRVVFSAHGSPPEDFEQAQARNLQVIDAVCPLVTRVHNEAKKYHRQGRKIILVGHDGHQEVKGTMGQAPMELVGEKSDNGVPGWDSDTPVAVLTQTTLSTGDTAAAIDHIREQFPQAEIRNDICYATTNRQAAVSRMATMVDMALVIGAQNSSNCNRLLELAQSLGIPAHLINGPEELRPEWLEGVEKVGIASGASTPEVLVDAVIAALNPQKVTPLEVVEEDISFVMPRELR